MQSPPLRHSTQVSSTQNEAFGSGQSPSTRQFTQESFFSSHAPGQKSPAGKHSPPRHSSGSVQNSPSLHAVPSATGVWMQRSVTVSQVSTVHSFPLSQSASSVQATQASLASSQTRPAAHGGPSFMHTPSRHRSLSVQNSPSSQGWSSSMSVWMHAPATHVSIVHRLSSGCSVQSISVPAHCPPEHASPRVQAFPSSHGSELKMF